MAHEWDSGYSTEREWHYGLTQHSVVDTPPTEWQGAFRLAIPTAWEPEMRTLWYYHVPPDHGGGTRRAGNRMAIIRSDNASYLGHATDGYVPYPNAQFFRWWAPYMADGAVRLEVAGALSEGRLIFATGRIAIDPAEIVPGDEVRPYLVRSNGHDGTVAKRTLFTSVRVVCKNTHEIAMMGRADSAVMSQMHRGDHDEQDSMMHELIDVARRGFTARVDLYRQMAGRGGFSEKSIRTYAAMALGYGRDALAAMAEDEAARKARVERIVEMATTGLTRGSLWEALNAVTEYQQHEAPSGVESWIAGGVSRLVDRRAHRLAETILAKPEGWDTLVSSLSSGSSSPAGGSFGGLDIPDSM